MTPEEIRAALAPFVEMITFLDAIADSANVAPLADDAPLIQVSGLGGSILLLVEDFRGLQRAFDAISRQLA